jgi:hypothetical protein
LLDPKSPAVNQTAPAQFNVKLETSKGELLLRVTRDWAPKGADRFYSLVKNGYYDECRFYRVLPKYIAQVGIHGDPKIALKWHEAAIDDDPVKQKNTRGRITFAKSGPNSRTTNTPRVLRRWARCSKGWTSRISSIPATERGPPKATDRVRRRSTTRETPFC